MENEDANEATGSGSGAAQPQSANAADATMVISAHGERSGAVPDPDATQVIAQSGDLARDDDIDPLYSLDVEDDAQVLGGGECSTAPESVTAEPLELDEPDGFDPFAPQTPEPHVPSREGIIEPGADAGLDILVNDGDEPEPLLTADGTGNAAEQVDSAGAAAGAVLDTYGDEGPAKEPKKHHYVRNCLIILLILLVIAAAAVCGWFYSDDVRNGSCHVPDGVTLDGVSVAGYSRDEVTSLVNKRISSGSLGKTTLSLGGNTYDFDLLKYGSVDAEGTVDAVMGTIDRDMLSRCIQRAKEMAGVADSPEKREFTIAYSVNKKKIKARVKELAGEIDSEAQDASYGFDQSKRKVTMTKSKVGYEVNVKKTVKAVVKAAQTGQSTVEGVAEEVQPKKAELGQAIYVDLDECHLYFYVNGKVKKDYACTPGKSGYETPSGTWYLEYKDAAPTWYNPHSDWAKDMPETIAPGETNPLGLRALAVSCGGGIYIHGTTNTGELGTHASHGCVRLANANVVELFDLVETGIPIFIY